MSPAFDFDAVVVGAGVVGLAIAEAMGRRGKRVAILERAAAIGKGVSSRNSGVVHAGLYYPVGSLRARLCVEGRRRLYDFVRAHNVAHAKCGKLVVAADTDEVPRLRALAEQARRNGVEGLAWLTGEEARAREPALAAVAALYSAETGIVDGHALMLALLGKIEGDGGVLALGTPFLAAAPLAVGGFSIRAGGAEPTTVSAGRLVIAAGLGAQAAAAAIEGYAVGAIPTLHFGKGAYFRLTGRAPFRALVYPLPTAGALGIHYTRDLGGQGRFGPDLEFVESETYDIAPTRVTAFERAVRRFWPGLPEGALQPDFAAIRPKIHGAGEAQPDFRLDGPDRHGLAGLIALYGIESPGLTSALAIGEAVAERLDGGRLSCRSRPEPPP